MSHLKIVNDILYKVKDASSANSMISIESIYYDNAYKSLFIIIIYQNLSHNTNIKYNIFIENILDNIEIERKILRTIYEISIKKY